MLYGLVFENGAFDEKRLWGLAYIVLAIVGVFFDLAWPILVACLSVAGLLWSGTALSSKIPLGPGIGSAGLIIDMITSKAGNMDVLRIVGNVALLSGMVYVILGIASVLVASLEGFGVIAAFGVGLLGAAIHTDKKAVTVR